MADTSFDFTGQKVVVTGAAGVYGSWIAAAFHRAGAEVCLSDTREDALHSAASAIGLSNPLLHVTDLRSSQSISDLAALVEDRWKAPDFVVNNAGIYNRTNLLIDMDEAEWDQMMAVNLRGAFLVSRNMARLMVAHEKKGSIVNISSGAAARTSFNGTAYAASKAALEALTRGLALELGQHGIRANAVRPGIALGSDVNTKRPAWLGEIIKRTPVEGRASGPDDTPNAVLYLCSQAASFVTGTILTVDGGAFLQTG